MSEPTGARAGLARDQKAADAEHGGTTLYIINLISSTTPMALEVPDAPELEGFAVFRSRRVEDGRDRFRLHLGYFESREEAQRVLPVIRARYPAAWIAIAPQDSMGSLDDTSVAQFKFIRQNLPAKPTRVAAPVPKQTAPTPISATLVAPRSSPAAGRVVSSTLIHRTVGRVPMTPAQVLQLLESAPRVRTRTVPAHPESQPSATSSAVGQKFAVQLVWSMKPVLAGGVPQLAIFEAYTLYSVQVERAGRRWYGLRLGFFRDPLSARQVALYARSDFSAAAVVPVSERECDKAARVAAAAQAAPVAAPPARTACARTDEIVLTPDKRSAPAVAKPRVATPSASPATAESAANAHGRTASRTRAPTPPQSPQRSTAKRRVTKTTEQLLEELGANELAIDTSAPRDELNDSGVRHLSVSIVSRQSPLARLLDRVGRRREQSVAGVEPAVSARSRASRARAGW